jgi:hypothetical protein
MTKAVDSETYTSGGPAEAGVIVIGVLMSIAVPFLAFGAIASRMWELAAFALGAAVLAAAAYIFNGYTPRQFVINGDTITFTRGSGREESFPKHAVYVVKGFSRYGPDALFCVKHSRFYFRFALPFTSNQSGEALTFEALAARGMEFR